MKRILLFASCVSFAAGLTGRQTASMFDTSRYSAANIIRRDVAVIGGGSTGTYGAIKLLDAGKSVVLIEKASVLGGHQNTYWDPATGTPIDYGVQAYLNISIVTNFFARFGIPIVHGDISGGQTIYADFTTGETIQNFSQGFDFTLYKAQLDKYPDLAWSWNLKYPVAPDLLLPWGEFIKKYHLEKISYSIYAFSAGVSNILDQVTVNVFKWLDQAYLAGIAGQTVTTAKHDNGELYRRALAELASSALISSTVIAAKRPTDGSPVKLVVRTLTGNKLIIASQLLVSAPPLLSNMGTFDLDKHEQGLFKQFTYSGYYNGLINNTGLPAGTRYDNTGAHTLYNIPTLPALYSIFPSRIPGLFSYWYGSPADRSQADIEADVRSAVKKLTTDAQEPEFQAFASHTPFKLVVSANAISKGFYKELDALQGKRNTWYTGAAFLSHNSGGLWNFTQALLPRIVHAAGPVAVI